MRLLAPATGLIALLLIGCADREPPVAGQPPDMDTVAPVLSAAALAAFSPKVGQVLYVPAYSSIYNATAHGKMLLTVTLGVHNTDPDHAIVLRSVRYYDTSGKLIREPVPAARVLSPLATFEHVVDLTDDSGGSGANFLVEWAADATNVAAPLVETVNVETLSGHGVSFTSRAVVVRTLDGDAAAGKIGTP